MAKSNFTKAEVLILMNGKQPADVLEGLKKRAEEARQKLDAMGDAANLDDEQLKVWRSLQDEIAAVDKMSKSLQKDMFDLNQIVSNLNSTPLGKLEKAAKALKKQIKDLSEDNLDELPKLLTDLASVENQIAKINGKVKEQREALEPIPEQIKAQGEATEDAASKFTKYLAIIGGASAVFDKLSDSFQGNLDLSDMLADVQKVTGLTAAEVRDLSTALESIDTRTSLQGLNELVYSGGKMGIQGSDNLLQFAKAADILNVSLGEDLGEGAIETLTKLSNVMGLIDEMGYEKALLSVGSAINTLTSTSVAAGEPIVDMFSRLAGVGAQAKLSSEDILALAAAADASKLSAETAATSLSQFITQLITETDAVAKAAGVSANELNKLKDEGKTMEAIIKVFEGLSKKGGLEGLAPVMGDLGSSGSRAITVISTLVNNVDTLKTMLNTSRESFAEASSATEEFNVKNQNAAAMAEKLKAAWDNLFVNSRMVERIEKLLANLVKIPAAIENNKVTVITAISLIMAALVGFNAKLTKMAFLRRIGMVRMAFVSLTKVVLANPFLAVGAALAVVVARIVDVAKASDQAGKAQKRLKDLSKEYNESLNKETTHISQLFSWLNKAQKGTDEYNKAKMAIQRNYGEYLKGLGKEIESLEDVEAAYNAITLAATQAAKARMAEKGLSDANETYAKNTGDAYKTIYDYLVKTGKYSSEEADSIMIRLRKAIDMGSELPKEVKEVADQYKSVTTFTTGWGMSQTMESDPVNLLIGNLRTSKKVLDQEVKDIEIKYGKLDQILAGSKTGSEDEEEDEEEKAKRLKELKEKEKRERLESARDEQKAALDALDLFYKQQEQVVNEAYLNREITISEREQKLSDIEERMMRSRIAARKVILADKGALEEWTAELERMKNENLAKTKENADALATISKKNLQKIGQDLRTYGKGEMDVVRKAMEQDRTNIQNNAIKLRQEIENILLENDFTGVVTRKYMEAMQKLKIFFPEMTDDMQKSAEDAMAGLYEIYPKLFDIDINTEEGVQKFRELLLGTKDISVQMTQQGVEEMKTLYYKALEYGDAMLEAQKKARERRTKLAKEAWRNAGGEEKEQALDREEKNLGRANDYMSRMGLSSDAIANDAQIALYVKRMELAQQEHDMMKALGEDTMETQQKLNDSIDALSNALVEKTFQNLETLKTFVDPLEDFGSRLGEAFAMDDAIDRQEAFGNAIKSLVGDVGEATKKMIMEWVKQKIQHSITRKAMAKLEKQSQKEMTGAVEEGQEAETALMQAGGAIQQEITGKVGDMLVSKKKEQAAENVSTQASETSANATMGIASGAAKTIGELGWWGIPLVAVITALINGLLSAAMSKVGSLFGGGKAAAAMAPTKLVTGMLTYDEGNVQSVLGNDGHVYSARMGGINGSGIVSVPTLTNVNGQAALVGEQGPEIVIGRTTTRAMMQNNPRLLASLVQFDKMYSGRGFRTYAGGNMQMYGSNGEAMTPEEQEAKQTERIMAAINATLQPTFEQMNRILSEANRNNTALRERLNQPFQTVINKFGRGGLVDEVASGLEWEKKAGRNDSVRRLFGGTRHNF